MTEQDTQKKGTHGLFQKALEAKKKASGTTVYSVRETPIVERDGIFSISGNLETSAVQLDPEFKALVDSVIN